MAASKTDKTQITQSRSDEEKKRALEVALSKI